MHLLVKGLFLTRQWTLWCKTNNTLAVVDLTLQSVFQVHLATGDRTLLSNAMMGDGPLLDFPVSIAIEDDRSLAVVSGNAVVRLDTQTGNRRVVSGCAAVDFLGNCTPRVIGRGQLFIIPDALAVQADGAFVVLDQRLGAVLRANPRTGDRTIVSQ